MGALPRCFSGGGFPGSPILPATGALRGHRPVSRLSLVFGPQLSVDPLLPRLGSPVAVNVLAESWPPKQSHAVAVYTVGHWWLHVARASSREEAPGVALAALLTYWSHWASPVALSTSDVQCGWFFLKLSSEHLVAMGAQSPRPSPVFSFPEPGMSLSQRGPVHSGNCRQPGHWVCCPSVPCGLLCSCVPGGHFLACAVAGPAVLARNMRCYPYLSQSRGTNPNSLTLPWVMSF